MVSPPVGCSVSRPMMGDTLPAALVLVVLAPSTAAGVAFNAAVGGSGWLPEQLEMTGS